MTTENNAVSFTDQGMPTHQQLVVPVIQAVVKLGGPDQPVLSEAHAVVRGGL